MMDWEVSPGKFVRLEAQPIFCANCGKLFGYVPKDNCSFACWLCDPCFEVYGPPPDTWVSSDHAFREKLQQEMIAKYGRVLTGDEVRVLASRGELGSLELLLRESPYKEYNG
jgi:hypothetical protein